jgi:hypothetical protein
MRYEVELKQILTVNVKASNPRQAAEQAEAMRPGLRATAVGDFEVIGRCEGCGAILLDGDSHSIGAEGEYLCQECVEDLRGEDD